jgi:class 3 adenylate cyclase
MTDHRRLAAIMVADVVGYSKLIGSDEAGTLGRLKALRTEIIEPQIAKHAGGCSSPWATASLSSSPALFRRWAVPRRYKKRTTKGSGASSAP